jgi:hypothetical protein
MVGLEEKLDTDPWIGQSSCCELGKELFFSWAVTLLNSVDDYMKDCYTQTMQDTYGREPYTDRAWKACGVLVKFSPCRVYIDSNRRDSRIWVPLICCDSHHVDNLMILMSLM